MKTLIIFLAMLGVACAAPNIIHAGPEKSAYAVILDTRIEGYFAKCDSVEILDIVREKREKYVGRAICHKYREYRK